MKKYLIVWSLVLFVFAGVAVAKYGNFGITEKGDENLVATTTLPVACIEEAMQCSDGSLVTRSGPNCDFEKCPVDNSAKAPVITYVSSVKSMPNVANGYITSGGLVYVLGKNLFSCSSVMNCEITVSVGGKPGIVPVSKSTSTTSLSFIAPILPSGTYDMFITKAIGQKSNIVKVIVGGYIGQDQTSDWQTYKNDEYGFEFKYPENYTLIRDVSVGAHDYLQYPNYPLESIKISMLDPEGAYIGVNVWKNGTMDWGNGKCLTIADEKIGPDQKVAKVRSCGGVISEKSYKVTSGGDKNIVISFSSDTRNGLIPEVLIREFVKSFVQY